MTLSGTFRSAVQPSGRRAEWPPSLFVEAWNHFVEQVIEGYSGDIYEYEDEVSVRDDLQLALSDAHLNEAEDWLPMSELIAIADSPLRDLLSRGPRVRPGSAWWHGHLPPYAGAELADDASRLFNVNVAVVAGDS